MKKTNKYLNESLRHLTIAERIISTYQLIDDKKLLLKILEEIQKSVIDSVNALNTSFIFTREIKDRKTKKIIKNLKESNFTKDEIKRVMKILYLNSEHKKSAMEFSRKDKIVIMMDDLKILTLSISDIKEHIKLAKKIYIKAGFSINNR